jgi:hypothetical protein
MVQEGYKDFGGDDISEDSNLKNRETKPKLSGFNNGSSACSETFNSNMYCTDKLP